MTLRSGYNQPLGMPLFERPVLGTTYATDQGLGEGTITSGFDYETGVMRQYMWLQEGGVWQWIEVTAGGAPEVPFTEADADGWRVTVLDGEDFVDEQFSFTNQGFNRLGEATVHNETAYLTVQPRLLWPDQLTRDNTKMTLNDFLYATSSVTPAINYSLVLSPKPIARLLTMDREVVGDYYDWEIGVIHRNAREGTEVPCVRVRATDGVNFTDWQVVGETEISDYCNDVYPVEVFKGRHYFTGLDDNGAVIRLIAQAMPWTGDEDSIADTEDEVALTHFSPRYFWRDTARFLAPPIAYVGTATGNDVTGVWSTNDATAAALPFATFSAAYAAIVTQSVATGGYADGCVIKVLSGGAVFGSGAGTLRIPHYLGAVTVMPAIGVTTEDANISWGTAALRPNTGVSAALANTTVGPGETALIFRSVKLSRTGNQAISGTNAGGISPPLFVQYHNCIADNGGQTAIMINASCHDAAFGLVVQNLGATASSALSGGQQRRCWRGLEADMADLHTLRFSTVVGSKIDRFRLNSHTDILKGIFVQSTVFSRQKNPLILVTSSGQTVAQCGFLNVIFEFIGALEGGVVRAGVTIATTTGNTDHIVMHHCVGTGFGEEGKWNLGYSGFGPPGLNQTHTRWSIKGCIMPQPNLKGDWWSANASLSGNLSNHHGVGFAGNWAQFHPNVTADESEGWLFFGRESSYPVGPDSEEVRNDPGFIDYQGTTGTGSVAVPGLGNGNYDLEEDSPARNIFGEHLCGFDLAGNARPVSGLVSLGCYI